MGAPSFNVYLTRLDGALASVVVDLAARPDPTLPHAHRLQLKLRAPNADGLKGLGDDDLDAAEDLLIDELTSQGAQFVGRALSRGVATLVLYSAGPLKVPTTSRGYEVVHATQHEPDWRTFARVLYPTALELQVLLNRDLLAQLATAGDDHSVARQVDHFALFDSAEHAAAASTALAGKGFTVAPVKPLEQGHGLAFHRVDALGDGRIDSVCVEVLEVLTAHQGRYDGWGCPVMSATPQHH